MICQWLNRPNRRQAIIWTNADPIHWRIYAALGIDELNTHTRWKLECAAASSDIAEGWQNETCVKQPTQEHMYTNFHWLNFKDVCRNEIYNNAKNHHFFLYCDLEIGIITFENSTWVTVIAVIANVCFKFENYTASACWLIAFTPFIPKANLTETRKSFKFQIYMDFRDLTIFRGTSYKLLSSLTRMN